MRPRAYAGLRLAVQHDVVERQLANKLRKAKKANKLSHAALKTPQQAESDERPMKVDLV